MTRHVSAQPEVAMALAPDAKPGTFAELAQRATSLGIPDVLPALAEASIRSIDDLRRRAAEAVRRGVSPDMIEALCRGPQSQPGRSTDPSAYAVPDPFRPDLTARRY